MDTSTSSQSPTCLLSEAQTADFLKLSIRTLQSWRLRGGGPGFLKLGRAVRYARADLEAWLAASRRRSTSDDGSAAAGGGAE